jgi:translation initiation factor 2B subunit (eIF-2B alpha/beta/delta family)
MPKYLIQGSLWICRAAALALAVNASGAVESRTTVLITPEEIDQATKETVKYRPPGK